MKTLKLQKPEKKTGLKNNKIFRYVVIAICACLIFFGRFIPIPNLPAAGSGVLFIFIGSLIMWLTISIGWPSLLCIVGLGCLCYTKFSTILGSSFGNSTFLFLLFTFVLTYALSQTTIIRRISFAFINNKLAKKNGYLFILLFLLSVLVLGLFIAPTVLFAIILPILNEILFIAKAKKGDKAAKVLMMGLGFTVSISSGMTTIAHVFPLLAMNAAGIQISAFQYMAFAMPVGLLTFGLMILMFFIYLRKDDVKYLTKINVNQIRGVMPKLTAKEITTLVVFIVAIIFWILPSILKDASPTFYDVMDQKLGSAMVSMVATIILCIIQIKDEPILKISDALKNGIPWDSLLMCAATLALGAAFSNSDVGLQEWLKGLFGWLSSAPWIALLVVFGLWAVIQTNLSSNMVTATLVASVAASIIRASCVAINLNATICMIGMLASFAFATPPSMPHIALVTASDYANTKCTLVFGSITMVLSLVCALCVGYPIATLVM